MAGPAYYNEIDPQAAQWIRNLIVEGVIAPGDVDERDVRDVKPVELLGYSQCHFFAGIGVWSYALRLAGWPDDRPVWTGSCPCQPFSAAGRGAGFADERHVWPYWHHLIRCGRPSVVFGEQVSSPDGLGWFDLVHADLEGEAYTVRPLDSCSAGVGAPHMRQRLWFMAYTASLSSRAGLRDSWTGSVGRSELGDHRSALGLAFADSFGLHPSQGSATEPSGHGPHEWLSLGGSSAGLMDHALRARLEGHTGHDYSAREEAQRAAETRHAATAGHAGSLAYADGRHTRAARLQRGGQHEQFAEDGFAVAAQRPGPTNSFWRAADWIGCRDGKFRPVEPGTSPMANGVAGRVGLIRGFGNAINPYNAAAVIQAGAAELEEAA